MSEKEMRKKLQDKGFEEDRINDEIIHLKILVCWMISSFLPYGLKIGIRFIREAND